LNVSPVYIILYFPTIYTKAVTRWLSRSESGVSGPENADSRAHIMQLMSELKSCSTVCYFSFVL